MKSNQSGDYESRTLQYYDESAEAFWDGTKDHDVSQNIDSLLNAIAKPSSAASSLPRVLDLGCGPGRDLLEFLRRGVRVVGLDGSGVFCEMARQRAGVEVLHQSFMQLSLCDESFDGIFANASLFHVPRVELPRVLRDLWRALVPGGVLFSSNPRGNGESFSFGRYGNYMEWHVYEPLLRGAGFEPLQHYYRPVGKPLSEQPWLASVSRKVAS